MSKHSQVNYSVTDYCVSLEHIHLLLETNVDTNMRVKMSAVI